MLGSVMDAEDVVQEAYLRWQRISGDASGEPVRSPRAYLSAVVTRLCIDHLRSARVRREQYVGTWLPEPLPTGSTSSEAADAVELDESLSMAFLVLLESLTPTERAVFVLRDVFGYGYAEISSVLGKSEANTRQILHRARRAVEARRPRFEPSLDQEERLVESFMQASASGDVEGLLELLSEDVILWSDSGGKTRAALNPIYGSDKIIRFFTSIVGKLPPGFVARRASINGRTGVVGYFGDGSPQSVTTFDVVRGRIRAIRLIVNPEKLVGVPPLQSTGEEPR